MSSKKELTPSERIQINQREKLRGFMKGILNLFGKYINSPFQIPNLLQQLTQTKEFNSFTERLGLRFVNEVKVWNEYAFKEYMKTSYAEKSRNIFLHLNKDDEFQKFIQKQAEERANLFKRIPVNLANHVTTNISKWSVQGMTSKEVSYKLREYIPNLLESQVKTIARTETSKTLIGLTSYKSIKNNIPCYQWKASGGYSGDGRTRNSHRHMSDVIVFWNDPPAPEDLFPTGYRNTLGHYHAGCCPNCRCVAMPVVFVDDLKFPVRVYRNGQITKMNKMEFLKLYNGKIQELKAEKQPKPQAKVTHIKNSELAKEQIKERKVEEKNNVREYFVNPNKNFKNYEIRRSYIDTTSFDRDCEEIFFDNKTFCDEAKNLAKKIFEHREETNELDKEELYIMDSKGDIRGEIDLNNLKSYEAEFTQSQLDAIEEIKKENLPFVAIHNHPNNTPPSLYDFNHIFKHRYNFGLIFCHSGAIYKYYRPDSEIDIDSKQKEIEDKINNKFWELFNREEAYIQIYKEYGLKFERVYKNS